MDNPLDKIVIKDLLARCIIGVNEDERREKQDVLINLALFADLRPSGRSDDLADSVDYRSIKKQVLALVEASRFYLVEALAEHIAEQCLAHHRVQRVQVTVEKPSALRFARSVGVEITRDRTE
ncbi:MAG: dihydroneopterin aldolase [Armatimonadota bacterium]